MIFVEKGTEQIFEKMEMVFEAMCLKDLDFEMTISQTNNIFVVKGHELLGTKGTNLEPMGQTLIFEASSLVKQGNEATICEATSLD